jgi:outer membrane lipoprotein-sorting protein
VTALPFHIKPLIPEPPMKKNFLKSAAISFVMVTVSFAQTMPLDTIIQNLSATYDKITSYSADAVIYKYYCS